MVEGDSRVNIISNNKTKKEITNLSKAHIKQSISKKKLFFGQMSPYEKTQLLFRKRKNP